MSGRIIHEKKTALLALWPSQNQAQHYFLHEANRLTTIKVECIYTKYILTSSQSNPTTFDRNCAFRWILPHRHPVTSGTLLEQLFSVNWPLTTNGLWTSVNSRIRIHTHTTTHCPNHVCPNPNHSILPDLHIARFAPLLSSFRATPHFFGTTRILYDGNRAIEEFYKYSHHLFGACRLQTLPIKDRIIHTSKATKHTETKLSSTPKNRHQFIHTQTAYWVASHATDQDLIELNNTVYSIPINRCCTRIHLDNKSVAANGTIWNRSNIYIYKDTAALFIYCNSVCNPETG